MIGKMKDGGQKMRNEGSRAQKNIWLIIAAVGIFTFMSTLDSSIINIALPVISKDLAIPMNKATWTVAIYLIFISGILTFFGGLGDQIGKIKVFKIGTYVFTIGSLLAGINLGLWFLLFARVVQALGAAMTMSNSFGIITSAAPMKMRARAMALNAMFVSLGTITGPGLGGLILEHFKWPYIFWVNVPIGIVAIIIGMKVLPQEVRSTTKVTFDYLGIISLFLTISIFFLGVNIGQEQGFVEIIPLSSFVVSIILLIFFIIHELHTENPLLDLTIFKSSLFTISLVAAFLIFTSNFFINVLLPFYFENLRGISSGTAGIYMMIWPVTMLIGTPISGYIADKFDQEYVTLFGLTVLVLSFFGWRVVNGESSLLFVGCLLVLGGVGMSFFQTPNNALIMTNAPKAKLGVAGALNALARNLGMISGTSLVTTILYFAMSQKIGYTITSYPAHDSSIFVYGMHIAFTSATYIISFTWLLTLYRVWMRAKKH
ncbi:MFS transporter [Liquorilactobacillus mali]|uniref:Major facilitator superfamily permease n=3 Tax=Liquorilactobacillus mali TaxID=1618 RepID=J0KWM7_9LACO|nr:MFS transporter [Liquorilactobacillus mali]EJE97545.1 major facilitator superfamily permease [Liquorilactobacillus mali KCTC 3596 = DSM 20444]KRN11211.1 major facilitator superfamily permease [Liquorilactobacillus mali KCTC 3596 = DSM 20444]KRN27381.1 major facilitator superfamily permease [Liquorilactobacillus mali]QFQ73796.1 MFS transporter [Liquorilactobacillus mali]